MTPGPSDPDRVDPTKQSGRSVIGPLALLLIFAALAVMVIVFMVTT
jgi:flagellar basal body-associated protein FliL